MNFDKYKYVSLEAINDIADGDKEFIKEIIASYLESITSSIDGLKEAIANNEAKDVIFFAHKLKGTYGFIGAEQLQNLARDIESNANTKELLEAHFALLTDLSEKVYTELQDILVDPDL